jgi:hypothetical protein
MSRLTAVLAALMFLQFSNALADTIAMKNGDVYRATVIKQSFGDYVQILMKDGSEKRLSWNDVASIEKDAIKQDEQSTPTRITPDPKTNEGDNDSFPSQMLNFRKPIRFELDLVGFTYDSTWQRISLQSNDSTTSTSQNVTNRYVRTVPLEFNFAAYLDRWHVYLNFLDASVNSNDISDDSFTTLSVAYGLSRYLDLGIFLNLQYMNTTQNGSSTSTTTGSFYGFGPQFHLVAPVSESIAIEASAGAGVSFRNITIGNSTTSVIGSDTAFLAQMRLGMSASLCRHVSYLAWVDGWTYLGTLDGTIVVSNVGIQGSIQDDVYRLRVVPVGLRIDF